MNAWVLAQFGTEPLLLAAAHRLRAEGHEDVDLHSPVPIPEAPEALGLRRSRLPLVCAVGGALGVASGYLMQWWMVAVDFPINVGNRPPHSPLAFVPITFELGILFGALAVFAGLLVTCGLPRPHHPVFEAGAFADASIDGLWLSVPAPDDGTALLDELRSLGATYVERVEDPDGS